MSAHIQEGYWTWLPGSFFLCGLLSAFTKGMIDANFPDPLANHLPDI